LEELADIMNSEADEQDDMQQQGQSETLTSKQKRKLIGDGTGLERWGGTGKMSIYNEGSCVTICDEEGQCLGALQELISSGNVSVRKITGKAKQRMSRQAADEESRATGSA
jgi:hypothetical protein